MVHSTTTASLAKEKSKPIHATGAALKNNDHPPKQLSTNLLNISECGNDVASFLSFHERGCLLLVNRQLYNDMWGIAKEKTYGPNGMSALEAARLLLRVACSEFEPERLAESCLYDNDAISALIGRDYEYYHDSSCIEGWKMLKNFWCPNTNCYDISSVDVFPLEWKDDVRKEMNAFFQKVNALLSQLKMACDYLEELEMSASPLPDLYQYLIEGAGVEQTWLDRFAEMRPSKWGKKHSYGKISGHLKIIVPNEPPPSKMSPRYFVTGHLVTHSVGQIFLGQYTIRALPSEHYTPKPIHLRECIKCHKVKFEISKFECPYEWCRESHIGKCGDCAPTSTCASCNRSGCMCCFVACASEGCTRTMCKCSDFYGRKDDDRGGVPGCSYVARYDDSGDEKEMNKMGNVEYCDIHKPESAVKYKHGKDLRTFAGVTMSELKKSAIETMSKKRYIRWG